MLWIYPKHLCIISRLSLLISFNILTCKGASLSDITTVYAVEDGTAVFPWSLVLNETETLVRISWAQSSPTLVPLLEVDGNGTPLPFVPRASTNGSAFLILTDVTANDVGTYRCTITTRLSGTAKLIEDTAELKMATRPSTPVVTLPSPPPVVGSTTALSCQSSDPGTPAATYLWYKGGTIITAGDGQGRYSFSQDGSTFTITGVQSGDEAMYSCKASNLAGEGSSTQHLMEVYSIPSKPSIQITVASVLQDQQTRLTCTSADYKPDPTYSWRKGSSDVTTDGTRLVVDAAAGTLSINQAQSGDMGGYTCTATNAAGPSQPSDVQQLEVRYRSPAGPSLSGFDSDSPPFSGQPNPLQCQITGGNPLPTLTWARDNVPISQVSTSTSGQTVTSRLTATLTARDNGKTYACTENHEAAPSPPRSSSVVLEVYYAPDAPTVNYDDSAVVAGTTLSVTCATNTGNPTPSISWHKVVPGGVNQPAGTAGQLEFDPITKDSNGDSYICTATNAATQHQGGDPPSRTITINVHYPPTIVSITPDLTVDEITDVSLSCTADCNPPPTSFTWNYNGAALDTTSTGEFTLNTSIHGITYDQAGTYTCTVANGILDSSTEVTGDTVVTVEYPPKFTHQEVPYTAAVGETVNLTCSAIAEPAITDMQWIWDGEVLTTGGQFTVTQRSAGVSVLTIADVREGNYGMYNCTAVNSKGFNWSIITLDPQGPPDAPTNLRVVYKNPDGHVTVQWTAGFNGGLVTTHTVDYKKLGDKDWTSGDTVTQPMSENHKNYNVSLQLGSQGNFTIRLRTRNSAGSVPALTVDVLIEGEAVLEGLLIVNQTFHPKYHQLDSQEYQDFSNQVVTGLDEAMRQENLPGYQGSRVTKLSPGSVVTDFKTTVATSEVQGAFRAFAKQVATGNLGSLPVVEGILQDPSADGGITTLQIIIISCACGTVVIVSGGGGVYVYVYKKRRGKKDKEKEEEECCCACCACLFPLACCNCCKKSKKNDLELLNRSTRDDRTSNGISNPALDTENSPDPAYAEVPSNGAVPMAGGNPYDDVHFEGDGTKAPVAGAAAGPLDPNVEYATVNKNNNETPNPSTIYAQVDKDKKKKGKEKPTLVVDPSSEYATVDKSKKKKKDMPPPPEDPSAQYSEVKKDKKKGKKDMPPTPEDPSAQYSEVKKDKKKDKKAPAPDVIYTEVAKDKKDKKEKKDKKKPTPGKKPAVAKKPTAKEERLYDEVPKAEGAAAVTDENPYENPQESMPEKQKNPQGLIYAELSDFQVKPPPKKPSKPAPPKPRYEDEPTEYASINWNASRRRAKEREQSGSTTDDETPVTMI